MKLAGMASNRGRNLLNIADRAPGGAEFAVVLTNDADAPVLEAAAERGIPTEVVERGDDESREAHEERVLDALSEYDFDLVTLDGYMRVLSETFIEGTPTTLNVHPSLLPNFPGMDTHEQVLEAGVKVTGCTVHVVDETVDGGPIVTQEPIPVVEGDDVDALKERVLYEGEFTAYPRVVKWFTEDRVEVNWDEGTVDVDGDEGGEFPARRLVSDDRAATLRYGENPHQDAALYADTTVSEASVVHADQLNEGAKALSYNNYNDADGALNLIKEFDEPAAAVIKHTNPAGCATADSVAEAYGKALSTDPMSAFGGIVALNRECDTATAEQITDSFKEVVVAPGYTDAALDVLFEKENLRKGTETVGIGMGQVSRVDAVRLAAMKADEHAEGKDAEGAVMASDAFFPFPDGIEAAAEAGIEAVIQPGGSKNDESVVEAADEHDMAMVMTGQRSFRHD